MGPDRKTMWGRRDAYIINTMRAFLIGVGNGHANHMISCPSIGLLDQGEIERVCMGCSLYSAQ